MFVLSRQRLFVKYFKYWRKTNTATHFCYFTFRILKNDYTSEHQNELIIVAGKILGCNID